MPVNAEIKFDIEACIENMGLGANGVVENFIANSILMHAEPYTPFDMAGLYDYPHRLIDSGHIENNNEVVWRTPYARYLYYHPEFNYQGAPMRGGYWVERMLQNGGKDKIMDGAKKLVKRLGG